jgi:hypothetical protein
MEAPEENPTPAQPEGVVLVSSDPAEIVRELAELERQIQDADAEVAVKKSALKAANEHRDELVAELRRKVREINAPPMPLFGDMGAPADAADNQEG